MSFDVSFPLPVPWPTFWVSVVGLLGMLERCREYRWGWYNAMCMRRYTRYLFRIVISRHYGILRIFTIYTRSGRIPFPVTCYEAMTSLLLPVVWNWFSRNRFLAYPTWKSVTVQDLLKTRSTAVAGMADSWRQRPNQSIWRSMVIELN